MIRSSRLVSQRVRTTLVAACSLLALTAISARAEGTGLSGEIEAALRKLGPHTISAVRVVSLSRGEVLYERNADLSLNPASNMKLLTSTTALARLGPDYHFTTRVLASSAQADGTVAGDLILQGGGDPVLETPDLEKLADRVKEAGVKKVTGALKVDDFRFDARRLGVGWPEGDEPYYYSAQISALTVNRNVVKVRVTPGKAVGEPATVTVLPIEGYVHVVSVPTTAAEGSTTKIDVGRERARNEVTVTGSIAAGASAYEDDVTVEEPELYAGALFRKLLADRGIEVAGNVVRSEAPAAATEIAAWQSPPLSRIVALLNKPSDNLVAEMLLKELGYAVKHSGTSFNGGDVVENFLKEQGIDISGVRVNDGSGLSRLDLITARVISDLLVKADGQPWKEAFLASLPIAGVDGTLRSRMKGTPAAGNVHAKTGSLSHVSALSGYLTTAGGERLAFSVVINNHPGPLSGAGGAKRIEDTIAETLAGQRNSIGK